MHRCADLAHVPGSVRSQTYDSERYTTDESEKKKTLNIQCDEILFHHMFNFYCLHSASHKFVVVVVIVVVVVLLLLLMLLLLSFRSPVIRATHQLDDN